MQTLLPEPPPASVAAPARAPRSAADIRGWIAGELAASLKVEPSAIDTAAPLESLGVDSLAAIGMTGGLAGWLGRDLPATLMWDYASIDAIADGLADRDAPAAAAPAALPGVIEFQSLGARRPVFFLPGQGGHPVTFAALASHLGPSQPCFGLTVPGLKGERPPLTCIEEIAAAMLETVRAVQPAGPYQLAGYSFGGMLAYEVAQQLTAAGGGVSMLAIYDTFTPAGRTVRPRWQRAALHAYLLATRPRRHARHLRTRWERSGDAHDAAAGIGGHDRDRSGGHDRDGTGGRTAAGVEFRDFATLNARAAAAYRPAPYPGSLLLFRATDRAAHNVFYKSDPTHGWGAMARGGVRVIDLPGSHLRLLDAAHAPAAAEALRPHLSA
jgi:thioesterase domain-containing protein/acyl carrier protein